MIETKHGEYEDFAALRKGYVGSREGNNLGLDEYSHAHLFDNHKLHISKLGACPRQQMYDVLGTEKKWETESKQSNDSLMFTIGYLVHYLTYAALDWAGILRGFEQEILDLPDPWTGRYDALLELSGELHLWSGKTTRPNAFKGGYRYSFPKLPHKLQEQGYLHNLADPLIKGSIIEYIDRGGTNSPLTYYVPAKHSAIAGHYMTRIEECYDALPELPDMRERELVPHYRKRANMNVYDIDYINDEYTWECAWCPYLYGRKNKKTGEWSIAYESPCKPDMAPPKKVAGHVGKTWHYESEDVIAWLEQQVKSYVVEDETDA